LLTDASIRYCLSMAKGNVLLRPRPDQLAALQRAVDFTRLSKEEIYRQALALWLWMRENGQLTDTLTRAGYLPPGTALQAESPSWDQIMDGD
jgi:hypothetical protein